jgi:iron complex outermembrane receptor protein
MRKAFQNLVWATAALTASVAPGEVRAQDNEAGTVFELDPFTVSAESTRGYQVRNTLSGTKFNALVKEVPLTITSLTEEFLDDTYSQTLEDSVRFTAGITEGSSQTAEESGSFYIRGLRALRSKRNGLVQLYSQDMTNVSRVEVVKGPMSLLYGQVEPGGIINYLTKKPLDVRQTELQVTGGSYDHYRVQLNHTGPLLKGDRDGRGELLYRFDTSYKVDGGWRDNTEDERSFYSGLLQYAPFSKTMVTAQWDYLNQNSYNAAPLPEVNRRWMEIFAGLVEERTGGGTLADEVQGLGMRTLAQQDPFRSYIAEPVVLNGQPLQVTDPVTGLPYVLFRADSSEPRIWDGYAEHWGYETNPVPANGFNDVDQHTISLEVKQGLWENWNARLYVVHHNIVRRSIWGNLWSLGLSGNVGQGYSSNAWKRVNQDYSAQLEITGTWELGPVFGRTFIGFEYLDHEFRGEAAVGGAGNLLNPRLAERVMGDRLNPFADPATVTIADQVLHDTTIAPSVFNYQDRVNESAFVSNLFKFFDDRLLILGGIRFDSEESQRVERPGLPVNTSEETSAQVGGSFELTRNINIYASYSESFVPQNGFISVLKSEAEILEELQKPFFEQQFTDPEPMMPLQGTGYEFGTKFDFLDERVSGSFAVFNIELTGVSKSVAVPVPGALDQLGNQRTTVVGSQNNGREISGFETELFFRPIPPVQIIFTYSYIDSKELLNIDVSGVRGEAGLPSTRPSVSVPRHQAGFWTKYAFEDGRLDGFSIAGGANWQDTRFGAYDLRSENESGSVASTSDAIETIIRLDDAITWDLMLSYTFERGDFENTIQLNVKNLLDDRFIKPGGMPNDPRLIFLTLKTRF